jgi:hypothetical protein
MDTNQVTRTTDPTKSPLTLLWGTGQSDALVQVICLTIDGQKIVCLGPVVHLPHAGILAGDVQEVEFGELLPASLAAKLLDGSFALANPLQ